MYFTLGKQFHFLFLFSTLFVWFIHLNFRDLGLGLCTFRAEEIRTLLELRALLEVIDATMIWIIHYSAAPSQWQFIWFSYFLQGRVNDLCGRDGSFHPLPKAAQLVHDKIVVSTQKLVGSDEYFANGEEQTTHGEHVCLNARQSNAVLHRRKQRTHKFLPQDKFFPFGYDSQQNSLPPGDHDCLHKS